MDSRIVIAEEVPNDYSSLCIPFNAGSRSFNSSGTVWPDIGAANEIPAPFFAFHITELTSTRLSVSFVQPDMSVMGDSGNWSASTADCPYSVVER